MIKLSNGHEFKYCAASGALGYDGKGYFWEAPFRWLKILRPEEFTIITKTITLEPRKGEYRWWKPWKTIKIKNDYVINAMGLPNDGLKWWLKNVYGRLNYDTIVSVAAWTPFEARTIAHELNYCGIQAIELNLSCPNVEHPDSFPIIKEFLKFTRHPVILKIEYDEDYIALLKEFHGKIEAVDAINTIPFYDMAVGQSPLHPLEGGISGPLISFKSKKILRDIKAHYPGVQVISGGGIYTLEEAKRRIAMKADAISFGTVFLKKCWLPNLIIKKLAEHDRK
jgi:dihydroorotate dehydrogenase